MTVNIPSTPAKQKYQLALWIEIWLITSGIICAADVSFTMLRPLTNKGGSLEKLYHLCKFIGKEVISKLHHFQGTFMLKLISDMPEQTTL